MRRTAILARVSQANARLSRPDKPDPFFWALSDLDRLAAASEWAPIQEMIDCGSISVVIGLLHPGPPLRVRQKAARIILNVAASSNPAHSHYLVDNGAVQGLISQLELEVEVGRATRRETADLRSDACWAIANICCTDLQSRDTVIRAGFLKKVIGVLRAATNCIQERTITWSLSAVARPLPSLCEMAPVLRELKPLIEDFQNEDVETLCNLLHVVVSVSEFSVSLVANMGLIPVVEEMLSGPPAVALSAVSIFVRLAANRNISAQIFNVDCTHKLACLLSHRPDYQGHKSQECSYQGEDRPCRCDPIHQKAAIALYFIYGGTERCTDVPLECSTGKLMEIAFYFSSRLVKNCLVRTAIKNLEAASQRQSYEKCGWAESILYQSLRDQSCFELQERTLQVLSHSASATSSAYRYLFKVLTLP